MIFDVRTYTCRPATIKAHMALYKEHGLAPQTRHLGQPIVYGVTEVGDVNSYVHIWTYDDITDRATKRAAMWADPDWLAYTQKSAELGALIKQENKILVATDFWKMPGS
ncbi:MAG: NIPSNAP family protein [Pseudomonadota bacterium]